MEPCHQDFGRERTKSEHVQVFAQRANAHTYVIGLGREVWLVVRCYVNKGERGSAARSLVLCVVTPHMCVRGRSGGDSQCECGWLHFAFDLL